MSSKDFLLWQRLFNKGDSQTASQPPTETPRLVHTHLWERGFSRRSFIHRAAGATGLALGSGLSMPALADQDRRRDERDEFEDREGDAADAASPLPIPGGTQGIPGNPEVLHFFFPAPNAEPSLITDFRGFVGLASARGTGTGINTETGERVALEFDTDLRFMKGAYVGMCDRERHRGTFAFI
jgi:hypothetical protein